MITPSSVFVVIVLAVGVMASSFFYAASRQDAIGELSHDLTSELKVFSGLVAASAGKFEYLPRLVSEYRAVSDALTSPEDEHKISQANRLLERLNGETRLSDIFVIDVQGNTIAASNWKRKDSFVGNNYAFRPYFFDAMSEGIGRFYAIGVTSRVPGYYLAHRIMKNKEPLGVIVVKVNISSLPISWENGTTDVLIADESDIIFLSSRPEWQYRPMWRLSDTVQRHLEATRQYDGMLKKEAPFDIKETHGTDARIVSDTSARKWYEWSGQEYFVKSYVLPGSQWTFHAVANMGAVNQHARMAAYIAFGSAVIVLFMLIEINQFYVRGRERKKYLHELEQAHRTLEKRNTELRGLNEELHFRSITDPLTGVFNRRHFMDLAEQSLCLSNRHGFPLSVLMIDVDHFKQINDTHGHPAGDAVLQELAGLFREELRESDILARWGGEEFIIALPHSDESAATLAAERILGRVRAHPVAAGVESISVTASSGVARHRHGESDINEVIKRADQALYEAKRSGRNRVCSSSSGLPV